MNIKQAIIDSTPILQVITHYSVEDKRVPGIETAHGTALPMQWQYNLTVKYSASMYADEAELLTGQAHQQMIASISDGLTLALCEQQVSNSEIVHMDKKHRNGWAFLCSPETFMKMYRQDKYEFHPDRFGGDFYLYDGVRTYPHNVVSDILVNTQESAVFNFDAIGKTRVIDETVTTITAKETIQVRGYWLIVSPTAKKI